MCLASPCDRNMLCAARAANRERQPAWRKQIFHKEPANEICGTIRFWYKYRSSAVIFKMDFRNMSRFCPLLALSNEIPAFEGQHLLGGWEKWVWPEYEGLGALSLEQKAFVHCSGSSAVTPAPSALHLRFLAQAEHIKTNIYIWDTTCLKYSFWRYRSCKMWMDALCCLLGRSRNHLINLPSQLLPTNASRQRLRCQRAGEGVHQTTGQWQCWDQCRLGQALHSLLDVALGTVCEQSLPPLLYLQIAQQKDNLDLATSAKGCSFASCS